MKNAAKFNHNFKTHPSKIRQGFDSYETCGKGLRGLYRFIIHCDRVPGPLFSCLDPYGSSKGTADESGLWMSRICIKLSPDSTARRQPGN